MPDDAEHRPQQSDQIIHAEWFLQNGAMGVRRRNAGSFMASGKNKRTGPRRKQISDRVHALRTEVHIQKCPINMLAANEIDRGGNVADAGGNVEPKVRQRIDERYRNEGLVLDDQNPF